MTFKNLLNHKIQNNIKKPTKFPNGQLELGFFSLYQN